MSDDVSQMFDSGGGSWNVPAGEATRQAIAPLRGYAYQLHQSLAAWIRLPENGSLYLEVAEDFATLIGEPTSLETVLAATQVKDTRASGAVTLNSPDVLDAIKHFWVLQEENPGRDVRMEFLTTSPIGTERRDGLEGGGPILRRWSEAKQGGPIEDLRAVLQQRFTVGTLSDFLREADDATVVERLIKPITWLCGESSWEAIDEDNKSALVQLGMTRGGTPDHSRRTSDALLRKILDTILKSDTRRLTRDDLLREFDAANSVNVPSAVAFAALQSAAPDRELALSGTFWRALPQPRESIAPRTPFVGAGVERLRGDRPGLWLHGATGLGKTLLAEMIAHRFGGDWRILDLRGISDELLRERLSTARGMIAGQLSLSGVIVDDLDPTTAVQAEAALDAALGAAARRGIPVIVTAPTGPAPLLSRSARSDAGGVVEVPYLTQEEVAELVAIFGGDSDPWARFIFVAAASGHPQLTDILVSGLAERGWPAEELTRWISEGFTTDDVESARAATRQRLFAELPEGDRAILTRTAHLVGTFDRDLVLAVAQVDPPVDDAGWVFDRIVGRWVENVGGGRHRNSPLVTGLARQILNPEQCRELDRAIALNILGRRILTPELADTACVHTVSGEAHDLVAPIAHALLMLRTEDRAGVAAGMPIFRLLQIDQLPFLSEWPHAAVLWQLAQHNLIAAMSDDAATQRSAQSLFDAVARIDAGPDRDGTELLVLSKVLLDQHGAGAFPNWHAKVQRFDELSNRAGEIGNLLRSAEERIEHSPVDFALVLHAVRPRGVTSLQELFQHLDGLEESDRTCWLDVLRADSALDALSLSIDQAWIRESQREDFDPVATERAFFELAILAESWSASDVAAKCHRARAILYDEYMQDADGGLAVIEEAETRHAENLDLRRARAKIVWRRGEHEAALGLISEIADEVVARSPLEGAFTIREAGISAAELGNWTQAASLFERGADAVAGLAEDRQVGFSLGLRLDSIAARFSGGEHATAIREMAASLSEVLALPRTGDRRAVYTQHLARHVLLWMDQTVSGDYDDDSEQASYQPGAGSNLEPPSAIEARPLSLDVTAWWLLCRTSLRVGLPKDEVLALPGVAEIREFATLDILQRQLLAERLIVAGTLEGAETALRDVVAAFVFLIENREDLTKSDPLDPPRHQIPALDEQAFASGDGRGHLRDFMLAFAARQVLSTPATTDLEPLHDLGHRIAGEDIMPEWSQREVASSQLDEVVASVLRELSAGQVLPIDQMFMAHLRLYEWSRHTNYRRVVEPTLADRVRSDWRSVLETQRFLLRDPALHMGSIFDALEMDGEDAQALARILLSAQPATRTSLSLEYLESLRAAAGS